jgi:hypothetical protein
LLFKLWFSLGCVLQTAATLHDQTQQLNKIVDDLNEIEFTMKKATKIIADIGKGIMTDRCAAALTQRHGNVFSAAQQRLDLWRLYAAL